MPALDVTIVQSDLCWHDAVRNREHFTAVIAGLKEQTDLIVLPEMFTTGFSMDAPNLAEAMDGESVRWLQDTAASRDAAICGSLIIGEDQQYYNRFICALPDGELVCYDKRHLFRLAGEQNHYVAGEQQITFDLKGFRVCPMVCYDLRFPVWSRNQDNYDLLLYVANWPERRHFAWETLLRARAIENLSYVTGVNRSGQDGNDIAYAGGSAIIDYFGATLETLGNGSGTATANLDLEKLREFRERFAFDKDADRFAIT